MKKWSNPELNVLGVQLSENIAASGTEPDDEYEILYLYYAEGVITRGGDHLRCKADGTVQDTSVVHDGMTVPFTEKDNVAGCIA